VLADSGVFGADLLVWLMLALGAAMVVGNGMALVRPPSTPGGKAPGKAAGKTPSKAGAKGKGKQPATQTAARGRSFMMMAVGGVVAVWALATLLSR